MIAVALQTLSPGSFVQLLFRFLLFSVIALVGVVLGEYLHG